MFSPFLCSELLSPFFLLRSVRGVFYATIARAYATLTRMAIFPCSAALVVLLLLAVPMSVDRAG